MSATVVITGASSGLGREFARRLAARGHAVALVARRRELLDSLAEELRTQYAVAATPVPLDMSRRHPGAALRSLLDEAGITEIGGLVHAAGFARAATAGRADEEEAADQVAVNLGALVDLTATFHSDLRDADSGFLVSFASITAYGPLPGMAAYGATKAAVLRFTEALWFEEKAEASGLRVLCVAPGPVRTAFFDVAEASTSGLRFQEPGAVADAALRALDRGRGPTVVPGLTNRFLAGVARTLPARVVARLMARDAAAERESAPAS